MAKLPITKEEKLAKDKEKLAKKKQQLNKVQLEINKLEVDIDKATGKKIIGPTVTATPTLHGRIVKLVRGGEEVSGVLMAKDTQGPSDNLIFRWKDKKGNSCLSEVNKEEIEQLKHPKQSR